MKVFTAGYGYMDLLTEDEAYENVLGYNDTEIDGVWHTVGESDSTGKIVEVRERLDGSLFAVLLED